MFLSNLNGLVLGTVAELLLVTVALAATRIAVRCLAGAPGSLLGVPLVGRGYVGGGIAQLVVVAGLAVAAAVLSFVAQRYFVAPAAVLSDLPEA